MRLPRRFAPRNDYFIKPFTINPLKGKIFFLQNSQVQDAVFRRLEIIGEAVKKTPQEFKDRYSGMPWKKIAGVRDILIHEYSEVSLGRIWKVAKEDIFDLREEVLKIKEDLKKEDV